MSVMIKGMKMPKSCADCPVGWCNNLILFPESDKRADNCPLLEIPDKHGRLFDETEVKRVLHDLPDGEYKWGALALLVWAVEKRWCVEAENE